MKAQSARMVNAGVCKSLAECEQAIDDLVVSETERLTKEKRESQQALDRMRLQFTTLHLLVFVTVAAVMVWLHCMPSPAALAIVSNVFVTYMAVGESVARLVGLDFGYLPGPKTMLDWAVLICVVAVINLLAFGPVRTSH